MKILVFFAHPDDETMLAGGTLALLDRQGAQVHYYCATHGEGGEAGEPPLCSQAQLGRLRSQEATCAVRALGGKSLTFLGYIDPLVGGDGELGAYTHDLTGLSQQIADILSQQKPDAVLTHGSNGEYGHPGHILTNQALLEAIKYLGKKSPAVYYVQAAFPEHPKPRLANKDNPAHIIIDITSVLEQKTQAALCHRTQHALFIRRTSERVGHKVTVPEVVTRLESLHRAYPEYDGGGLQPSTPDPLFALLLSSGAAKLCP